MKKLFISQPMNGLTDEEILAKREKLINEVKTYIDDDIEVIDSFFKHKPANASRLWCIGESIKLMGEADIVCFAKGYECARGCRIEYMCAKDYGIEILEEM